MAAIGFTNPLRLLAWGPVGAGSPGPRTSEGGLTPEPVEEGLVMHLMADRGESIRIISARLSTRGERRTHEEG